MRNVTISACLAALLALPGAARAADWLGGDITITPRFQLTFTDRNARNNPAATIVTTDETVTMPFYGLSLQYSPTGSQFDVIASGFYGTASGNFGTITLGSPQLNQGSYDASRLDLELLGRYRIPNENAYLLFGARYLYYRQANTYTTPGAIFPRTGGPRFNDRYDVMILEAGVGASGPLTQSGSLSYFGNLILGLATFREDLVNAAPGQRSRIDDGIGPSFDISAGLAYAVAQNVSLSVRYRALILPVSSHPDFQITHGPEIALSYRF